MMKKLMLLISLLVLMIVPVFSQGELPPTPGSVWELVGQFSYLIGSFPGTVVLMFFLVPALLGALNVTGKFLKYLVTVVVLAGLSVAAYFLSFGFLHDSEWWTILVNTGLLALIQIGGFAWNVVRTWQDAIYEKFNPWKT